MNTSVFEASDNLGVAESYYNAMLAKHFDKMAGYLHDNVHFTSPLAEMHGKEPILQLQKTSAEYCRISRSGHALQLAIKSCSPMTWSPFRLLVVLEQQS